MNLKAISCKIQNFIIIYTNKLISHNIMGFTTTHRRWITTWPDKILTIVDHITTIVILFFPRPWWLKQIYGPKQKQKWLFKWPKFQANVSKYMYKIIRNVRLYSPSIFCYLYNIDNLSRSHSFDSVLPANISRKHIKIKKETNWNHVRHQF